MHMSQRAIRAMLQPASETIRKTKQWLSDSGIPADNVSLDGDVIYVDTTLKDAEDLLQTKYRTYRDVNSGMLKTRALKYGIPVELRGHIDTIQPTTMFGSVRAMKSSLHGSHLAENKGYVVKADAGSDSELVAASCNTSITPDCLRELYGFQNYTPPMVQGKTSLLGIGSFLEEYANFDDTEAFLQKYDPADAKANFTYALINGGYDTFS